MWCDLAYVLQVDQIRAQVGQVVIGALVARAMGGEAEVPDVEEVLARFDAELAAEPKRIDPEKLILMRALGVAS